MPTNICLSSSSVHMLLLVKWYGGVPIINEVQDIVESSVVPRYSTKDCIEFICNDLTKSAEMLAPFTQTVDGLLVISGV